MMLMLLPIAFLVSSTAVAQDFLADNLSQCVKTSYQALEESLTGLRQQVDAIKSAEASKSGSTYVRWGRKSCPAASSTTVYKGYASSKQSTETGSGTNILCLHETPKWGKYLDGKQGARGNIIGTTYERDDGEDANLVPGLLPDAVEDKDVFRVSDEEEACCAYDPGNQRL